MALQIPDNTWSNKDNSATWNKGGGYIAKVFAGPSGLCRKVLISRLRGWCAAQRSLVLLSWDPKLMQPIFT